MKESGTDEIVADLHLCELDRQFGVGRDLHTEVAKAITIAVKHKNTEARVLCTSAIEYSLAHVYMSDTEVKRLGFTWRAASCAYELSNGSAVSIHLTTESRP